MPIERLREIYNAFIWSTGSDDFGPDGKARVGWEKIVKPLLDWLGNLLGSSEAEDD